jgi:hypothetical protein
MVPGAADPCSPPSTSISRLRKCSPQRAESEHDADDRFPSETALGRAIALATEHYSGATGANECFATHPSASLDNAGARFRHLGGLRRTLGINGSRSSGARVSSKRHGRRVGRSLLAHCATGVHSPPPAYRYASCLCRACRPANLGALLRVVQLGSRDVEREHCCSPGPMRQPGDRGAAVAEACRGSGLRRVSWLLIGVVS